MEYFEKNRNPFRRLWEYSNLEPHCASHSSYTYAAFLSLTQANPEIQNDVRLVGTAAGYNKKGKPRAGMHYWLEERIDGEWKTFETVPGNVGVITSYLSVFTFQLTQDKTKVTSELFGGLFMANFQGFLNS